MNSKYREHYHNTNSDLINTDKAYNALNRLDRCYDKYNE